MLKQAIRLTQPVSEPVSLAEAKESLRIPSLQTIDDGYITALISSAREQAEQFIDRPIAESNYVLVYDLVAGQDICLQYPASAVSSVTYRDGDNAEQSVAFTYDAQLNRVFFDQNISGTGLKVTVTSGQVSDFPESMTRAIIMLVGDLYTGRASAEYVNKAAIMKLMPFKNKAIL